MAERFDSVLMMPSSNGPIDGPRPSRILLVEDEEGVREFVARALRHVGYEVRAVGNGLDALETLARERFDLLLSDIVMPGLDGIGLALKVTKEYPGLSIILMTGYATEWQRAYGLERLIQRVITKPFSLKQICTTVQEVLGDRAAPVGD